MSGSRAPSLSDETIALALEVLLGYPPYEEDVAAWRGQSSLAILRLAVMREEAFRRSLPRSLAIDQDKVFALPLELLRAPEDPSLPWRFAEPDLRKAVSQMATLAQVESPEYARWCGLLRQESVRSSTQWANVWLLAMIEQAGLLKAGPRVLGLDLAEGHIACLLARLSQQVVVTLRDGVALADLNRAELVESGCFETQVSAFAPGTPAGFDLVWSNGSVERCTTLENAMQMIMTSIGRLKPGGVALHVISVTLSSDSILPGEGEFTALRRQDLLDLVAGLMAQGHAAWPINLHPGSDMIDAEIDSGAGRVQRFKRQRGGQVIASFGLALRRGPSPEGDVSLP